MNGLEAIIRAQLDRSHPLPDSDPDWNDVLERLAHAQRRGAATAPGGRYPRRLRKRAALVGVALAAAAAVLLLIAPPWRDGSSFVEQALSAVGSGRYVHAVLLTTEPGPAFVDLTTGHTRPSTDGIALVYDTQTHMTETRSLFDGVAFASPESFRDPAVTHFVSGYRNALERGEARIVGATTAYGHKAKIIRFPIRYRLPNGQLDKDRFERHSFFEDVAVSEGSFAPLWVRTSVRQLDPRHAHDPDLTRRYPVVAQPCPCRRVVLIESSNTRPSLPKPQKGPPAGGVGGEATDLRTLNPVEAAGALRHPAFWVGRTFEGASLRKVRLQQLAHWPLGGAFRIIPAEGVLPPGGKIGGPGLRLDYRGAGLSLEIDQSASQEPAYGFMPGAVLPPLGEARLSCGDCVTNASPDRGHWQALLRKGGLYVRIRSTSRSRVVRAALALAPIQPRG